jgi:hypothetical protein
MGKKLVAYYDFVESVAGRDGKVALAKSTCVPSVIAMGQPDDAKMVEKFRQAVLRITGREPPPIDTSDSRLAR